jgi:hypothetical protein
LLLRTLRPELLADDSDLVAIAESLSDLPLALQRSSSYTGYPTTSLLSHGGIASACRRTAALYHARGVHGISLGVYAEAQRYLEQAVTI